LIFLAQNRGLSIVSSLKIKDRPPDTKLNIFEDPHLGLEDVLCKIYASPLRAYMFKEGAFFQRRGYDTLSLAVGATKYVITDFPRSALITLQTQAQLIANTTFSLLQLTNF
jgi:hypothetical protein